MVVVDARLAGRPPSWSPPALDLTPVVEVEIGSRSCGRREARVGVQERKEDMLAITCGCACCLRNQRLSRWFDLQVLREHTDVEISPR